MSDFDDSGLNARQLEPLEYTFLNALSGHISTSTYLVLSPDEGKLPREIETFYHNNTLWEAAVTAKRLHHGSRIRLDSFFIFEWVPRAPGLFWTPNAKFARAEAKQRIIKIDQGRVVYNPYGKQSMLDGGIGNIRLNPLLVHGSELIFMSASANGICHQGFPIAVSPDLYMQLIDEIRHRGAVVQTLMGRVKLIPKELTDLYTGYVNVPKLYLQVEEATQPLQRKSRTIEDLEVSVAVSFEGVVENQPGIYATYVTFDPGNPVSFAEAINWMKDEYVQSYDGRILTDFDEQENHFLEAQFSLKKVMRLGLQESDFESTRINIGYVHQIIGGQTMIREQTNYNITGGNIGAVGNNARAENFTQNTNLMSQLGDLAAELSRRARTPEELVTAQQVSEAEQAAKKGDNRTVGQKLKAAGLWAFQVATEIGKDVAAKAISSHLGLGT
jgi:hypothetical protein